MQETVCWILAFGCWTMLTSGRETVRMIGVALTVVLFGVLWACRGKLNSVGLQYIDWNRTPIRSTLLAVGLGSAAGLVIAWWFRGLQVGKMPPIAETWIALTWGPLIEEAMFRGYLFRGLSWLLERRVRRPGWLVVTGIAAVFALGHLLKSGITPTQIATIFLTGCLYGWLRLESGSTVPPVCAHMAYNTVIFSAAALLIY